MSWDGAAESFWEAVWAMRTEPHEAARNLLNAALGQAQECARYQRRNAELERRLDLVRSAAIGGL